MTEYCPGNGKLMYESWGAAARVLCLLPRTRRGRYLQVYRCPEDPRHYHLGNRVPLGKRPPRKKGKK